MKKPSTLQFKRRPYHVNYLEGFWLAYARDILKKLSGYNYRSLFKGRFSFKLRWEHLIIAFLLGALLFSSRTGRVFPDGLDIPHQAPKPIALMADTKLQPQAQVEAIYVAPPPPPAPVNNAPAGCGDNFYANYIYMHESGCSTTITNYLGCLGIGQSCPASKLLAVCPNEDYGCENQFFTNYANAVYGGWGGAYNFWVANHWW